LQHPKNQNKEHCARWQQIVPLYVAKIGELDGITGKLTGTGWKILFPLWFIYFPLSVGRK